MKFSDKVLLMPALAGLSFIGTLLINEVTGTANSRLIGAIESEYLPALELRRSVENDLRDVQRSLQDVVEASDPEGPVLADFLSRQLQERLRGGRTNAAFRPGEIAALETAFARYYEDARATTVRMIAHESGEALQPALQRMATQYTSLRRGLEASTVRQRAEMQAAMQQARENHRRSVRLMTLALLLGLAGVGLVSRVVIRSTIGSLRSAVAASAKLSRGPLRTRSASEPRGDEIAHLLASMQEMMAAVADSEGRLSEAQRLAHVGSWEWDAALCLAKWSEETLRIFGISAPPSRLGGFLALVHPDDRTLVKDVLLESVAAREPFRHSFRILRSDGEARMLMAHGEVLMDAQGELAGLRGAFQDVTESDRTAAALRESEERYRALFERNPEPMWVYDVEDLRFLAVNESAVAHYGHSRDEFLRMTVLDVVPEEDRRALRAQLGRSCPGLVKAGPWRQRRKDGSLFEVEASSHEVVFGTTAGRLVLVNDVTEKSRLEQQLRQAQKMEAVGRLSGGVAHDFNNILNVIMGYGDIVSRRLPPGDPLRGKVAEILKAAERAAGLTRQLLAFSRKQVLQPRVLDLNIVVADMEKMLRRLIGENIELTTRLQPHLGATMADLGQMEQVLMNLAVNARDAMPEGGTLILETQDVELDDAYVRLHPGSRRGRHVVLAVSDTGHGMDAETQCRIFEPFFTTKEQGKGTGLGLSTVYGIVEQSGGRIDVYSEKGQGTTFKVYLPRTDGKADVGTAEVPVAARPAASETVLLVEDEASLRSMIREVVEQNGYRVLEAATPGQALAIAQSHVGNIHLILTDVVMPEMNGRDLAERVKPLRPGAAVVYMSGYTADAIGHHGLLDGATHFIQKPFTPDRLALKLREALAQ